MLEEIWKDIPGFEGIYQVSTLGYVKVLSRPQRTKSGSICYRAPKILKLQEDDDGYYKVGLHKDGKQFDYRVNRLVAITFIPNPKSLPIVHHKDNNKKNNSVDNLEWVSVSENTQHAINTGRLKFDFDRLAKISRIGAEKRRKPVKCITTNQEYSSMKECALAIGISNDVLVRHIVTKHPIHDKLFVFSNPKDIEWAESVKHKYMCYKSNPHAKPVICISTGQRFESRKDAGKALNISPDSITYSIKLGKPVKGYYFTEEKTNDAE